jgi:hypothetical protein
MPAKNMIKTMSPRTLSVGLLGRIVVLADAAIRQTSGFITAYLRIGNAANPTPRLGNLHLSVLTVVLLGAQAKVPQKVSSKFNDQYRDTGFTKSLEGDQRP